MVGIVQLGNERLYERVGSSPWRTISNRDACATLGTSAGSSTQHGLSSFCSRSWRAGLSRGGKRPGGWRTGTTCRSWAGGFMLLPRIV
eukprot:366245-Chlamydomonas_euryale.AAC.40